MFVWGHSGRIDTPATFAPCPLRSNHVRGSASQRNDAACQSRPSTLKQKAPLFDHLVGTANARDFAERDLWNIRLLKQPHSDLMPANLITLAHFSVSSAISFPKSAGDPGSATPPRSARRAFILGSSRAALTSLLSLSTISAGVALGAPRPDQLLAS